MGISTIFIILNYWNRYESLHSKGSQYYTLETFNFLRHKDSPWPINIKLFIPISLSFEKRNIYKLNLKNNKNN